MEESNAEDWRKKIVDYLEGSVLPNNQTKARKVKAKAARYVMVSGEIYQRSFFGLY